MKLSIIILSYNTADETVVCIQSLSSEQDKEIIVVDNNSQDNSVERIKSLKLKSLTLVESKKNLGFANGCSLGVDRSNGEYIAFINSDCRAKEGAIKKLVSYLDSHPEVSVVVPKLLNTDGTVQHNIAKLPTLWHIFNEYILRRITGWYPVESIKTPVRVEAFSGAAFVIRRKAYLSAGGFPKKYFMYVEDVELSRALKQVGKKVVYLPEAVVEHDSGLSSVNDRVKLNKMLHKNREDYCRTNFNWVTAILSIACIRIGLLSRRVVS